MWSPPAKQPRARGAGVEEGMTWAQLGNVALVGALIILASALTMVLTGLDRRLTDYRHNRARQRLDGDWR